jgi:nitrilase
VVCLPEAFTGVYGVQHFLSNAEELGSMSSGSALMSEMAHTFGIHVTGGVIEHDTASNKLYNTVVAYGPDGGEVARYRKLHLSCVTVGPDATSESDVLTPGDSFAWFDVPSSTGKDSKSPVFRFGLACCFDLRFKEVASTLVDDIGANVLLFPSAWLNSTGQLGHWETLLRARALDGQCYVMGVNQSRNDFAQTVSFGRTCIVGPLGEVISVCVDDGDSEVVVATLNHSHLDEIRQRIPVGATRKPDIYDKARAKAKSCSQFWGG